jgi:hypothetical protein
MRRSILMVIGCAALASTVGTWASQEHGQRNADPSAKERAALAREKYEDLFRKISDDLLNPPLGKPEQEFEVTSVLGEERAESFGRWSARRMNAERDSAVNDTAAVLVAVKAHRDRMRDLEIGGALKRWLEERIKPAPTRESYAEVMKTAPAFADTIRFFRLEAESLVGKASENRTTR